MLVVARATTGRHQMDRMDDVPDATARNGFIGVYLDVSHNLCQGEGRGFESRRPLQRKTSSGPFPRVPESR